MNHIKTGDAVHVSALAKLPTVRHGFFTRNGGESGGIYASNNCGFGTADSAEVVARNRNGCLAQLGLESLVTVHQRHTADVVVVDTPFAHGAAPVADAMVTRQRGIALGILTADCGPVLFADDAAGIVGAAHAGWRGAFSGVLEHTLEAMTQLGARRDRITAALGPCIAQASYEVGPEFVAQFVAHDGAFSKYFTPAKANGRSHFDLGGFVGDRLRKAGVGTVIIEGSDTCADAQRFFSFRRATLSGETDYGRQLSAIGLTV